MQPLRFVSLALALALTTSCSSDSQSGGGGTGGASGGPGSDGGAASSASGGTNPNAGGAGGSSSGGDGTANGGVAGSSLGGSSGSASGGASVLPDGGVAGAGTAGAAGAGSDSGLPPVPGPCCEATGAQGCTDKTVQDCVCAQDPLCCKAPGSVANAGWGTACVALIGSLACGTACPTNDCCTASTGPGCTDTTIQTCVCALEATCCTDVWDGFCVTLVTTKTLGKTCGTCP